VTVPSSRSVTTFPNFPPPPSALAYDPKIFPTSADCDCARTGPAARPPTNANPLATKIKFRQRERICLRIRILTRTRICIVTRTLVLIITSVHTKPPPQMFRITSTRPWPSP